MTWFACAPSLSPDLDFSSLRPELPIDIGRGIRLEVLPEWVRQSDKAIGYLAWPEREAVRDAELCLTCRYEATALGTPDPDWRGDQPRPIQDAVSESLSFANVASWLVRPSSLGCSPLFHFSEEGDSSSLRSIENLRKILIGSDESDYVLSAAQFLEAGQLLQGFLSLERRGTLWLAIGLLLRAVTEKLPDVRYLLHWMLLEALFGPDQPGETTYRLCQRIALFLGEGADSREKLFRSSKDAYSTRSKIVHGRASSSASGAVAKQLKFIEMVVRTAVAKILNDGELRSQFGAKKRDAFLDSMVLRF